MRVFITKLCHRVLNKKVSSDSSRRWGRHCRLVRETGLGLVATTQSRELISTLLRSSVFRGSDNTLCCHSRALPFKPRCLNSHKKRRHTEVYRLFWCEKRDLNPYGVTTRPSNVRVCQFRHSRI